MNNIIDYLEHWAATQPDKCFSTFLDIQGNTIDTYTYSGFNERSRHLAEYLSKQLGLNQGDRVLLVYPPGLEVIVAFVACARIGVIPVPVYPPTFVNFEGSIAKLTFIAHDCGATIALTTLGLYRSYQRFRDSRTNSSLVQKAPILPNLDWFTTDNIRGQASELFRNIPNPILFLQYTSGSTSEPKGVIVSHENAIHNCHATTDHIPIAVCWLPQYHDMGLIGYYVFLIITGGTTYGFSPMDFLKRPVLWLETLSRVQATYTSSPNFGFEYCLREDKLSSNELCDLDLSSVRILMNASEPVPAETYRRFVERFAPYGLQPQAPVVAYGLAENTLAVTNYGRRMVTVNKQLFQEGKLHIENTALPNNNQLSLMSCGRPLDGIHVRIVDPKSRATLDTRQIGEIWVAGKSNCRGYWNRPELTDEVFHNSISNNPEDHNIYLSTGDLGFLDEDELFVCGRIKDVIIVRGINYYPQDIERIVEAASQKTRSGGVVAFGGNDEEETLVVVVEVRTAKDLPDPARISHALRTQYYVGPHTIIFVPTRTITKTTSGKLARSLTRQRWLNHELQVIATYVSGKDKEVKRKISSGLRERFQYLLDEYNLTGDEEYTLAEIGIDSLNLVNLLLDIEQVFKEYGANDMMNQIDARVLQRLTVAEFFSILDQLKNGKHGPIADLELIIKQLKKENDDHERDSMRWDAKLGSLSCSDLPENDEPLTSILLTGPTGFFGPYLLSSLLLGTPYTYFVLVRAPDPIRGMERIRESLHKARVLTPTLSENLHKRIQIVCGDIAQHNFGMRAELWKSLTTQVQAVIHNAAFVNYVLNYDALSPHNVAGTRELLRFSSTGIRKEFHLISSTIIFGWTLEKELLESENNEEMLNLDFGYAQTKWVSEQLVLAAAKQGLRVRIYRPSFLSASTSGVASSDDIVIRLLTFMINHSIAVNSNNQISLLPADIAANNIANIFNQRGTAGGTLHVTLDDYYNLTDITRLITSEYGYPFIYYEISDFVKQLLSRCSKDDPLYPLLDFISRSHPKIAAMQLKRYKNDRYREARQLSGNNCADPTLKDIVSYLITYMRHEGSIPEVPLKVEMVK